VKLHLALDTATDVATIAVGTPGHSSLEVRIAARRELSRGIEREVARLLERHGSAAAELAAVVVADGPGSFTGLRIGLAFAKGLCRVLGVPLLTAPSLLGAARAGVPSRGSVLVRYDALRGQVYRAAYRFDASGGVCVLLEPELADAGSPVPLSPAPPLEVGAEAASAAALLRLVGVAGGARVVPDPAAWEPNYGRPAEAEARRLAAERLRGQR
jgi:tRNA threonylcarbamoyladenosine biosynthesis protein TsaB